MICPALHAFVDRVLAAGRISSDEVRHLHREILPDGIPSRAVADALLALDRTLEAGPLWSDFLTPAVVNYAVWGLRPTGVVNAETANWLLTALTIGEPTPTALRILGRSSQKPRRSTPPSSSTPGEQLCREYGPRRGQS
jgi:hypothetical protein